MQRDKHHYISKEAQGYVYQGTTDGLIYYSRETKQGFINISVTDSDIENGNLEIMMHKQLTR